MNAKRDPHDPAVLWLTPQELDAARLEADSRRVERGETFARQPCPLTAEVTGQGHKTAAHISH